MEKNRVTSTFPVEPDGIKEKFVFNPRETLIVVFLAVLCTIAMHLLRSVTLNFVYGFTDWGIPNPAVAGTHSSFLGLIIAAISLGFVCPIIEELYFRRMLFQGFRFLPQLALVTASTLLFALAHGNLNQAIFVIPLGVFCSVLFLRTNSIIYPAAIHIFVNITSLLGLDLDKHLFSHSYAIQLQDRAAAKMHGLFGALLLLLLATGAYYCFKALRPSSPERSQDVKAFLTGQGRGLYALYAILYLVLCLSFGLLQYTLTRWGG